MTLLGSCCCTLGKVQLWGGGRRLRIS